MLPCFGHCVSAAVDVWYSLLVHDLIVHLFSNSNTSLSWFDWLWWEEMQLICICHVDMGIGHTSLYWLPLVLPQSSYHPSHLSSNLTRLFGQEVCIGKCPTPMTALFVNPSSLLRVPFLPCLLGVTSVPYSPSTRGEDNPLNHCVVFPTLEMLHFLS